MIAWIWQTEWKIAMRRAYDAVRQHLRASGDVKVVTDGVTAGSRGLLIQSPNGTWWRVKISDAGALTVSTAGVNPPPE